MGSNIFSVLIPSKGKKRDKTMPAKSTTTITGIQKNAKNQVNRKLIEEFSLSNHYRHIRKLPKWAKGLDKVCRTPGSRGHPLSDS